MRWIWPRHKNTGDPGTANGGGASQPLISVLPGGPKPSQIANPAGLFTSGGTALNCGRATSAFCQKSTVFDTAQILPYAENYAFWGNGTGITASVSSQLDPVGIPNCVSIVGTASGTLGTNFAYGSGMSGPVAGPLTASIYLKSVSGATTIYLGLWDLGSNYVTVPVDLTTSWQRFSVTTSGATPYQDIIIGFDPAHTSAAFSVLAALPKIELGSSATPYVSPMLVQLLANQIRVEPKGILREFPSTNLLLWSTDYTNVAWTKNSATVTAAYGIAPDGTPTAQRIQLSGAANVHQAATVTGTVASAGTWMRATTGTVSNVSLVLKDATTGFSTVVSTTPTLTTQWQYVTLRASSGFATGNSLDLNIQIPSGTADIEVWNSQLEAAVLPSSPIVTGASTATRAADHVAVTLPQPIGSTLSFSIDVTPSWSGTDPHGSYFLQTTGATFAYEPGDVDVSTYWGNYANAGGSFAAGITKHYVESWDGSHVFIKNVTDGTTSPTVATVTSPAGQTTLQFDSSNDAPSWISNLKFYNRAGAAR